MPAAENRPTLKGTERHQRRLRQQALYDEVHEWYRKTKSIRAVAGQLVLHRQTVRKYLACPQCSFPSEKGKQPSILEPHRDYILTRWTEGCRNATPLYREIVRLGYTGSRTIVKDFVSTR